MSENFQNSLNASKTWNDLINNIPQISFVAQANVDYAVPKKIPCLTGIRNLLDEDRWYYTPLTWRFYIFIKINTQNNARKD